MNIHGVFALHICMYGKCQIFVSDKLYQLSISARKYKNTW